MPVDFALTAPDIYREDACGTQALEKKKNTSEVFKTSEVF